MPEHDKSYQGLAQMDLEDADNIVDSTFATRYMTEPIPKCRMPDRGFPANVVYQVIKDMRTLDARPNLNLASFVTTWMEPEARQLMNDSVDVNFVDTDEYPSCTAIANRCINMLARLYHSPAVDEQGFGDAVGAASVGSSEAIMLGGLAMKKRWAERRKAAGLDSTKPNLVMSSCTHVCWEKFCRYWDVEPRYVPAEEGRYASTPELLVSMCDENTIGVVAVLGTTYTGEFEDVAGLDAALVKLNKENGWEIVIHVDGASGGFVAPFIYPEFAFDFRLPSVASINVSGHKYGLVYPGLGWAIWRDSTYLPESMVFYCDYLGTVERTITLNFSRGAAQIIAQYYQLLRLGFHGYTRIMGNLAAIAARVKEAIENTGHFEVVSKEIGVPVVAFRLTPLRHSDGTNHKRLYDEFQVAERMRIAGWIIPAYAAPHGAEHIKIMRITIREDFSMTMAEQVLAELNKAVAWLDAHFTMSRQEMADLSKVLLGRALTRMDTQVVRDLSALKIVKPC